MKNKDYLAIGSALGAAFFWSFSFVWFKIAFLAYNPLTVVIFRLVISAILITIIAYQNIIGIIFFLPLWLIVDFNTLLHTPFHAQAFRAIILLAVFSSTLAFVFFTESVRQIGVIRSNTFINLIPVFVAIFSYLILKEQLGLQKVIGIIIVVAGLFLAQIKQNNGKRKAFEVHNA